MNTYRSYIYMYIYIYTYEGFLQELLAQETNEAGARTSPAHQGSEPEPGEPNAPM